MDTTPAAQASRRARTQFGHAELSPSAELPLPAGAEMPSVAFGTNDVDGSIYVGFHFDDGRGLNLVYDSTEQRWNDPEGAWSDLFPDIDLASDYLDWCRTIAERIGEADGLFVSGLREDERTQTAIVAAATGTKLRSARDELPLSPDRGAAAAEKILATYHGYELDSGSDDQDELPTIIQDLMTDLIHAATKRGVDVDEVIDRARAMASYEIENPEE